MHKDGEDRSISYYEVLQVEEAASYEQIKASYQRLVLIHHPDKSSSTTANEDFRIIHEAWKVLSDAEARSHYDESKLQSNELLGINAEAVSLEEEFEFDGANDLFTRVCRCGGTYEISSQDLADGFNVVPCDGCSLHVRVHH
mmetsp:Transcript_3092/g.4811  ORF Transcript_3092/g.4811 Transcript_3092/m.4811 type:complete len:142 (+) Transcript_3092:99-524(+)|eukprot:CAMPEP_0174967206 /NCGR_PEP_ID=MMETSP0004_2-20121128/7456_1 /TAXON_ID=420556 /ORGANISM="Ochromonas sp., Strain CCMP1393" /LENGTH=141 /DNA_ID=CAMNT_0016216315 /DNA_START=81 /DNA_END=506 /DNA_ORIENTATION=-